jgi:hypothetical protein
LEWRLFVEQQVDVEWGLSVAELLYRYGVRGNCVLLVPWLHWWAHLNCPEQHGHVMDWLLEQGCQLFGPYETALVLADLARAGVPLQAELAYAMIRNHPNRHSATTRHYGDPVSKQKFLARFGEQFSEGMPIKQTPKTTTVHYFAQCPDLGDLARDAGYKPRLFDEVPDVYSANDGFVEVIRILNAIVNELVPPSSRIRASVPPKPVGLTLNPEKVKALTDESASIQGILSRRLGNLEEPNHRKSQPAQKVNQDATADAASSPTGQPALAGAYQAALRDLLQRTQWSRAELEALAKRHCLLPFAFYQAVNEWTMAAWGDYLLDGQEVVHVNQQLLNQIPYE